jgi:restriction system protein
MTLALPKLEDFYFPVLSCIDQLGGSGQIAEIDAAAAEFLNLKQDALDARYPKSGSLIIPDRTSWARTYLRIGGLLKSEGRGLWVITDAGREALAKGEAEVRELIRVAGNEYNRLQLAKKANEKAYKLSMVQSGEMPDEEGAWSDLLLAKVQTIDPYGFERLCQLLLRKNGFTSVEVTGKTGDGGIDGKGVVRVNLVSFHVLFQCKRYQGSVSTGTVRDFRGAMQGRADKGLIITTGTFTPDARREATRDGAPAIDLIDGQALCELLKDNELGVRVEMVEQVTLLPEFFDEI